MRLPRTGVTLALILLTVGMSTATVHGDAGTGEDAGDSPAQATLLPQQGSYDGMLVPPGDADWYELIATGDQPRCYQAMVGGGAVAEVTLSLDTDLADATARPVGPGLVLDLGLAAPSSDHVLLGLDPQGLQVPTGDPSSGGPYRFDLQVLGLDEVGAGDAGTGSDAGASVDSAANVTSPCFGGHVGAVGDHLDVYTFTIGDGEHLTASLAQGDDPRVVRAALISPSGDNVTQLEPGQIEEITTDEAGTWSLTVWTVTADEADLSVTYLAGLTINGPEPPPCRPGCVELFEVA